MKFDIARTFRFRHAGLAAFLALVLFLLLYIAASTNQAVSALPLRVGSFTKKHNEVYTPLGKIPTYTRNAAISSQDKRFYTNLGIDLIGTGRALLYSVISHQRQGASTITEQLAKNAYFHDTDNFATDIETKLYALFITARYHLL